jgi:hypothetical protein
MADHFYSVTFGNNVDPGAAAGGTAVVVDTSTTAGSKIELRITDSTTGIVGNRFVVLAALEKLKSYFTENNAVS